MRNPVRVHVQGRAVLAAFVGMLIFAACRKPVADAGGPHGDRVAKYIPKIEEVVGRPFKTPPKLEIRTRDQVRAFLLAQLEDSVTRRELAGQTATYRALGLIPDTMDLARLFIPLLTEQIGGYYDPKTKVLYVVEGIADALIGVTIPHELVHALQDQYIDLDSIQHITGDDDRQLATHAVIEGQAQYAMFAVLAGKSGIVTLLPTWIEEMRRNARESMSIQPVFASSPLVIRESLLFPYINGVDFVGRVMARNAAAWPLDDPPRSTEQVMHDSAYFGATRDAPATLVLPPVAGKFYENTMGEFGTRLFLFKHLKGGSTMVTDTASLRTAAIGASGWSGDRFVTFNTTGGTGIAWVSVWDTPQDAAEFTSGLDSALVLRYEVSAERNGTMRTYRAPKRTAVLTVREIGSRLATLYVDVPAGASTAVLDLTRVVVK